MIWLLPLALLNAPLDLPNLGFEAGLRGWTAGGHPGFRADVLEGDAVNI